MVNGSRKQLIPICSDLQPPLTQVPKRPSKLYQVMGIGAPTLKSGWHTTTQLSLLLVGVTCLTKHTRRKAQIDQRLVTLSIIALTREPNDPTIPTSRISNSNYTRHVARTSNPSLGKTRFACLQTEYGERSYPTNANAHQRASNRCSENHDTRTVPKRNDS